MHIPFSTSDVITGLIGFGLVAKGIVDKVVQHKAQTRPACQTEHEELYNIVVGTDHKVDKVITILEERRK